MRYEIESFFSVKKPWWHGFIYSPATGDLHLREGWSSWEFKCVLLKPELCNHERKSCGSGVPKCAIFVVTSTSFLDGSIFLFETTMTGKLSCRDMLTNVANEVLWIWNMLDDKFKSKNIFTKGSNGLNLIRWNVIRIYTGKFNCNYIFTAYCCYKGKLLTILWFNLSNILIFLLILNFIVNYLVFSKYTTI